MKHLVLALLPALSLPSSGASIIDEDFSGATLSGTPFTAAGRNPFEVSVDNGRLRTGTDVLLGTPAVFGVAAGVLDGTAIPDYPRVLGDAPGRLTWSFDLEYFDGSLNGSFVVQLAMSEADRFSSTVDGYALVGGGFGGNEMVLGRVENGLITSNIVFAAGGPPMGSAVRIQVQLTPSTGVWSLAMSSLESGAGLPFLLLGSGVDTVLLGEDLPHLSLGSTTTGLAFYDNFSLEVIPEPEVAGLLGIGFLVLGARRRRGSHPTVPGL